MLERYSGLFVCLIAVGALLYSAPAHAADPRAGGGHSSGFLLRLSVGPGFATTSVENDFAKATYSGGSGDVNLAIGGIVTDNVAIHATLGGWSVFGPDVELKSDAGSISGTAEDATLRMSLLGPGATVYFADNFYFSGSLCAAFLTAEENGDSSDSDTGVAVDLTVGKEWWASRSWGLGVAGGVGLHSIPLKDSDNSFTGASLGIRFSATYN